MQRRDQGIEGGSSPLRRVSLRHGWATESRAKPTSQRDTLPGDHEPARVLGAFARGSIGGSSVLVYFQSAYAWPGPRIATPRDSSSIGIFRQGIPAGILFPGIQCDGDRLHTRKAVVSIRFEPKKRVDGLGIMP